MVDIIRVDHEALAQIAGRFGQQSEAAEHMLHAMRGTMEPLANGGWIGQGADAFFAEMNSDMFPAVQRLSEALAQAGFVTTQLSGLMQQADEEASFGFRDGDGDGGGRAGVGIGDGGRGDGGICIGIGIGIGGDSIGVGIDGGGGADNSYTVPGDWLDGVTDSLGGGTAGNQGDYGIPRDWLDGVTDPAGGGAGAGSGGSGDGAASETAASESTGGGSGGGSAGGSSETDINDPYGQSGSENGRSFRSVGAAGGASTQAGGFQYQSLAGGSSGGGTAPATTGSVGGGAVPTAAIEQSGNAGLPFGLAAATPFLALLGKAAKDQVSGD